MCQTHLRPSFRAFTARTCLLIVCCWMFSKKMMRGRFGESLTATLALHSRDAVPQLRDPQAANRDSGEHPLRTAQRAVPTRKEACISAVQPAAR